MVSFESNKSPSAASVFSLQDLKEAMFNGHSAEKTDLDVFAEMANDKSELLTEVESNPRLLEKAGSARRIRKEISVMKERYGKELQTIAASKAFAKKVEKPGWGRWALDKVKSAAYFPVKHWKLTLLALLVAGGYYLWPQIVSMAQGVWATRGLAAASEIGKVSEVVGALEQAHTLEGIGSAAASVPEGLVAPIPSAAGSTGFQMLDPSLPIMKN